MRLAVSQLPGRTDPFLHPSRDPFEKFCCRRSREARVRRTERLYFITTRFYRGDPAGSSLFALPCL